MRSFDPTRTCERSRENSCAVRRVMFQDPTNGKGTYGGGRLVYAPKPPSGITGNDVDRLRRSLADADHDQHHSHRNAHAADPRRHRVMLFDFRFDAAYLE